MHFAAALLMAYLDAVALAHLGAFSAAEAFVPVNNRKPVVKAYRIVFAYPRTELAPDTARSAYLSCLRSLIGICTKHKRSFFLWQQAYYMFRTGIDT
jgi:hypothetical protein